MHDSLELIRLVCTIVTMGFIGLALFYLCKTNREIKRLRQQPFEYEEFRNRLLEEWKREYYRGMCAEIDHCIKECENINFVIREKINPDLQLHKSGLQKIRDLEARISAYPVIHDKLLNDVKILKDWLNAQQQLIRDLEAANKVQREAIGQFTHEIDELWKEIAILAIHEPKEVQDETP